MPVLRDSFWICFEEKWEVFLFVVRRVQLSVSASPCRPTPPPLRSEGSDRPGKAKSFPRAIKPINPNQIHGGDL